MILNGALVSSRYKDEFIYTSCGSLFHGVLDQRFVHYRQHFFGQGLGGGQESGAQTTNWKNRFFDHLTTFIGEQ
mgnify:CR=1